LLQEKSLQNSLKTVVLPFVAYLLLFVGLGFVSGSIVHLGETSQISRFVTIGIIGMVMFVLGSYLQEIKLSNRNLPKSDTLLYILYSLALSVGIGMMSGGTQHFLDFPVYASYLLPFGLVIAFVFYILRSSHHLSRKVWSGLIVSIVAITIPVFLGLNAYAKSLPTGTGHHAHDSGHEQNQAAEIQTQVIPTVQQTPCILPSSQSDGADDKPASKASPHSDLHTLPHQH
jgi:hypothetical protein